MISPVQTVEFILLLIAAISDFRYRKINNGLIILMVINSFFNNVLITQRVAAFFIPFIFMIPLAMKHSSLKGGDIKYISAVGAFFGIDKLTVIICLTVIFGAAYCFMKHEKSFPLAFVTFIVILIIKFVEVVFL